jgi:hypothetical protein
MKSLRSLPVLLTAALGVFMVLPIAVAANAAAHVVPVTLPVFHSQVHGQNVPLSPISAQKAQAIHAFKLAQI